MSSSTRPPVPPSPATDDAGVEPMTADELVAATPIPERRPYFLCVAGDNTGSSHRLGTTAVTLGRAETCGIRVFDESVSHEHAELVFDPKTHGFSIVDLKSKSGTFVNGRRIDRPVLLVDGDKVHFGGQTIFKYALFDELDERYERRIRRLESTPIKVERAPWSPDSWRTKKAAQAIEYPDPVARDRAFEALKRLPPLVTSWEVEDLKAQLAEAQDGRRFLLQGGDCAETLADCNPSIIANKLKILMQMSLVLTRSARRPLIRVGRFAGQYAKPRSNPTEIRNGVELPSYFGDLVNRAEFTEQARTPDPELMLKAYSCASMTLNFIRALTGGSFADLRHPEYYDLSYFENADLPSSVKTDYVRMSREVSDGIDFVQAVGSGAANDLMKVTFFTSHEGLNLHYESAQARTVPMRAGWYDTTTHLPWIGERTRQIDGAHVEFFRGVENPIAVKLGPKTTGEDAIRLCQVLNPANEPGKMILVTRMGAKNVAEALPKIVSAVTRARHRVLWVSDPMHGNAVTTRGGIKTRDFEEILNELEATMDVHQAQGTYFGGVHFELTGEDVTECIGGGLSEADLSRNYSSLCDPRLNYRQALQMAFSLGRRLAETARKPTPSLPPR